MDGKKLKVLVIGSGGREHTLVRACAASPLVGGIVAAPGNAGMAAHATCVPLDVENVAATVELARRQAVDFVVVGPEAPLCLGVVDALREAGILAYGPGLDGARLEGSKVWSKAFLQRQGIPTAAFATFTELPAAQEYIVRQKFPLVIKASGLAAGKGVIIARHKAEALAAAKGMLEEDAFGASGREIVVEEFLEGEEASLLLMVSGTKYVFLPASQDHKRIGDGDTGPNTGGMGAYAPAAVVTPALRKKIAATIIEPTLAGLVAEGIDYRGTLYIGVILTADGPKVLEYNARFGDPEAQVVLPLLENDLVALMLDCARGTLNPEEVRVRRQAAVVVVLTAEGYPGPYRKGDPIHFPSHLPENVHIIHAGTRSTVAGEILTNGGRVLGVTALGRNLREACAAAYQVCEQIEWAGRYFRHDIGARQLNRE